MKSCTFTLCTLSGPLLVTVTVKLITSPSVGLALLTVFAIRKSAKQLEYGFCIRLMV